MHCAAAPLGPLFRHHLGLLQQEEDREDGVEGQASWGGCVCMHALQCAGARVLSSLIVLHVGTAWVAAVAVDTPVTCPPASRTAPGTA